MPSWIRAAYASLLGLLLAISACTEPAPQVTVTSQPAPPPPPAPAHLADTALVPTRDSSAETTVQISETTGTLTGTNLTLADLISVAFRTPEDAAGSIPLLSPVRVVPSSPLPEGRYDVRVYAPRARAARLRAALRKTLADSFGLTVRREMRETPALVLVAPTGRLKASQPAAPAAQQPDTTRTTLTGTDLALLAEQLEEKLQRPVVNESGLRGGYTFRLEQPLAGEKSQPLDLQAVRAALREQLGLDLLPAQRCVEFLVVDVHPPLK